MCRKILVALVKLVWTAGIEVFEDADSVEYFHILFDQQKSSFHSTATESLFTGPEAFEKPCRKMRAPEFL